MRSAIRACPFPHRKGEFMPGSSTSPARLGRRVETVDPDQFPPVPGDLISQHLDKTAPANVRDGFGVTASGHAFDIQVFQTDRLVFTNQPGTEFVAKVVPAIP